MKIEGHNGFEKAWPWAEDPKPPQDALATPKIERKPEADFSWLKIEEKAEPNVEQRELNLVSASVFNLQQTKDDIDAEDSPITVKKELADGVIGVLTASGPSRRRRCLLDAVVVPSLASLGIKRPRDIAERSTAPHIKKIKKLERSEGLAAGTLRARLVAAGIGSEPYPINLSPDIKDVCTRRDFMRGHYGGNAQQAFPPISNENYMKTGYRYFMYPNLVQNPEAPMIPGAPGLFLSAAGRPAGRCARKWASGDYNLKVLSRLGANNFLYMGEYAIRPADSLSLQEWAAQSQKMRNRWCNVLANYRKKTGKITRTRICLRRQLARNPTYQEVKTAIDSDQPFPHITGADIAQAFDNGDEKLAVWTMECVGYDEQFQREVARQMADWVPPPPKPKQKRSKASNKSRVNKTPKRRVQFPSVTVESAKDESEMDFTM